MNFKFIKTLLVPVDNSGIRKATEKRFEILFQGEFWMDLKRFIIAAEVWEKVSPHLAGKAPECGAAAADHRFCEFINNCVVENSGPGGANCPVTGKLLR
ncbi:MAG: hypothetical protein QF393_16015 [Rhodospirillales bacterium]|jgi:hypothetical protein|nr:hypothetical protein [Rhodospirillaceae bacterium]MDP6429524.1 hypothetical protein [Rhodospirillales bacterium]MDP6646329.1 hypothetical protein [Rhodospirillales bacterium]|tara:strand:+ start:974 stop:1270 length:297 start_codon:yes stop_codon:yes gene_type:complete